jgi:hypothetical protein
MRMPEPVGVLQAVPEITSLRRSQRATLFAMVLSSALLAPGCVSLSEPVGQSPESGVSVPIRDSFSSIRGYVVYAGPYQIVIDLTARDGLKPGSLVSLRRDKILIVHPITGKFLGELEEELGIAKVIDVRHLFSVAEIQPLSLGHQIKVKDRVVPLDPSRVELERAKRTHRMTLPVVIP